MKVVIWEEYNIEHIKKHSVTQLEAENAGRNISYHKKTKKDRYLTVSRVDKRIITLIIRRIKTTTYYLVSARDASKKEREGVYEKEKRIR